MENKITEFDEYADTYNDMMIKALGKFGKYRYTAFTYKIKYISYLLGKYKPKSILDFGCGIGSFIPYLHSTYKDTKLYGCDISSKSIEIAKLNYPYCDFKVINNIGNLNTFKRIDLIIINTVLHHIPQVEHEYWLNGLFNILENGGGGEYCYI